MKPRITALLLFLIACATACDSGGRSHPSAAVSYLENSRASGTDRTTDSTVAASMESMWLEQKLIRHGDFAIEVAKAESAVERAAQIAKDHEGLLADTSVVHDEAGNRRAVLTLRVPSRLFDRAVEQIRTLGVIRRESMTTEDVSKAYVDLEVRLTVKRQAAERLRELLGVRTAKLADILEVERELARVVGEIEQLQGDKRYYDQRVAISTIRADLYEPGALMRPGITAPLGSALRRSLEVLVMSLAALVYLVVFLVPWLLVTSLLWWIVAVLRRRRHAGSRSRT